MNGEMNVQKKPLSVKEMIRRMNMMRRKEPEEEKGEKKEESTLVLEERKKSTEEKSTASASGVGENNLLTLTHFQRGKMNENVNSLNLI